MNEDEKSLKMEYASECHEAKRNVCLVDIDGDGVPDYVSVRLGYIVSLVASLIGLVTTYLLT